MAVRLGVDLGERRVGFAICDALEIVASPWKALPVRSLDAAVDAIRRMAGEASAEEIIIGHPLHMSGRRGPKAREAEGVAERLRAEGYTVSLWDERLSTAEAERGLRTMDLNRRQRKSLIDAHAAQRILASYLSWRAARGPLDNETSTSP